MHLDSQQLKPFEPSEYMLKKKHNMKEENYDLVHGFIDE